MHLDDLEFSLHCWLGVHNILKLCKDQQLCYSYLSSLKISF